MSTLPNVSGEQNPLIGFTDLDPGSLASSSLMADADANDTDREPVAGGDASNELAFGVSHTSLYQETTGDAIAGIKAPFPYFGGKAAVARLVWDRFGNVPNFVDPFAGSLSVLLARPHAPHIETVNDLDGFISNFWRALQADPEAVAYHADWPVNECDQHARHVWLVERKESIAERLMGDPDYYDAKIAGWWVWGICCWIGAGWCSGNGSWVAAEDENGDRVLVKSDGEGAKRKRVHLGNAGQGVHRQRVHLGNAGQGVHRKRVHLGPGGNGMQTTKVGDRLYDYFQRLADRLRRVRVCCGDWSRVCGPTPTVKQGLTGVFLDPPYADTAGRQADLYRIDSLKVAHDVRKWALEWGDDPRMRIALCGYEGEHEMPDTWEAVRWKAHGGYGCQGNGTGRENAKREVLWFSPHCLKQGLFAGMEL